MKTPKIPLILLLLCLCHGAKAGDAVFSREGTHVYKLNFSGGSELSRKRLSDGSEEKVSLARWLGNEGPTALSPGGAGRILCATAVGIWAWDDVKGAAEKLCTVEEGWKIRDIAYNPAGGWTLIGAIGKIDDWPDPVYRLFVFKEEIGKLMRVNSRRVEFLSGMAFSKDGLFFFGTEGDLWVGQVREESIPRRSEDPEQDKELAKLPPEVKFTLRAIRCAPLATRETQNTTPGQKGVRAVAVTNDHVYAHVARMGGSGWGKVVRLDRPEMKFQEEEVEAGSDRILELPFALEDYLETYRKALGSVESLGENGRVAYLCSSPDGAKAYYEAD